MATQTRKCELYREAGTFGREASFIANVIFCHHRNPAKKLAGLVALLRAGHSVSLASFNMDVLQIDGAGSYPYGYLENIKLGDKAAPLSWEERVQAYEAQGITRSDAQAIVDAEDLRGDKAGA
jgi:hypothetical protein